MANRIDKELEEKRKQRDGDLEHKIACLKGGWKIFIIHPLTYLGILSFICFGIYYNWNPKEMIENAFGYLLTAILTGLVQHLIIEKNKKQIR